MKNLLPHVYGIPLKSADTVWQQLTQHFAYPQNPLGLRAYTKRLVDSWSPRSKRGVFRDQGGNEYLTVQHAAAELDKHKTTMHRWIQDGSLVAEKFSYQVRSGGWKTVLVIARTEMDRLKEKQVWDEQVVEWIRKARRIKRASAERTYRRLKARLQCVHKHMPTTEEIIAAL